MANVSVWITSGSDEEKEKSGIITLERALLARTLIGQPTVCLLARKSENLPGNWLDFFVRTLKSVCILISKRVCLPNRPQVIRCLILLSGYLFFLNLRRTSARLIIIIIIILLIIIICLLLTICHAADNDNDGGGDNGDSLFLTQV